jgi:ABC-type dipeptide/oligopeptide/nickel transport system permease subunit
MSTPSVVVTTVATTGPPRRFRWGTAFATTYLVVLLAGAVLGDALWFVPSYSEKVVVDGEIANRYALGPSRRALFGTDQLGYDVLAKCLYGARTTLLVGVGATVIGVVVGGLIGIVAGYRRGATDRVVGVVTDCLLSLPAIVLAIVMISKLDVVETDQTWLAWLDRRWQLVFTLGVLSVAPLARIVRAQTLTLREREFVLAARSLGAPTTRILTRELLPNLVPTMLTVAFTGLGILVAAEGALAFLGLSAESPTPTWGKLIEENRDQMDVGWWATIFPCLLLFLTVLSFNLIGEALSRRLDIRRAAIA